MEITYTQFDRELFRAARERRVPVYGSFELTSRCNLDCAMCYIRKAPGDQAAIREELTAAQWLEIGRQARDEGLLYLLLTGGEVFLRPDFFEILDGLCELGFKMTVNTNATMITKEIAARLASYSVAQFAVTLYGASPETYGRLSGNPAGFEKTLSGIRNLKDNGFMVRLRTTVVRQNLNDLGGMFDIADELDLPMRLNVGVFPCRKGVDNDPLGIRLTPQEQLESEDYAVRRKLVKRGLEIPAPKAPDHEDIMAGDIAGDAEQGEDMNQSAFTCAAGHYMFNVTPKGRLVACMLMDDPSVSMLPELDFRRAWEELKALSDEVPVCRECRVCKHRKYCKPCPARVQGETDLLIDKTAFLCERAKLIASGKYLTLGTIH